MRRIAPPGTGRSPGRASEESTLLIDATLKHTAPPLALPAREFMEHARDDLAGARPAGADAAAALARLFARRLVEQLGRLRRTRRRRGMGSRAAPRRFARRRGGLIPETPVREVEGWRTSRLVGAGFNNHTTTVSRLAARVTPV